MTRVGCVNRLTVEAAPGAPCWLSACARRLLPALPPGDSWPSAPVAGDIGTSCPNHSSAATFFDRKGAEEKPEAILNLFSVDLDMTIMRCTGVPTNACSTLFYSCNRACGVYWHRIQTSNQQPRRSRENATIRPLHSPPSSGVTVFQKQMSAFHLLHTASKRL